jgi:hypothetical protein
METCPTFQTETRLRLGPMGSAQVRQLMGASEQEAFIRRIGKSGVVDDSGS